MDAPTIFDLLDRLAFLRGAPSVVLLLAAAFVAVVAWDLRLVIAAVFVHYLLAGFLFVDVLDPRLAFVYTLAGLFVTAILLVTAWQVNWGRRPSGLAADEASRLGLADTRPLGPFSVTQRGLLRLGLPQRFSGQCYGSPERPACLHLPCPLNRPIWNRPSPGCWPWDWWGWSPRPNRCRPASACCCFSAASGCSTGSSISRWR